jgi:hypothetical protein
MPRTADEIGEAEAKATMLQIAYLHDLMAQRAAKMEAMQS